MRVSISRRSVPRLVCTTFGLNCWEDCQSRSTAINARHRRSWTVRPSAARSRGAGRLRHPGETGNAAVADRRAQVTKGGERARNSSREGSVNDDP